jgi:5-formyltetrahydrofolate cyclo-ligase
MPLEKSTLRRDLRARLRAMSPDDRTAASARICAHLSPWTAAPAGRLVAGFLPLPSEPDPGGFYRSLEAGGGRLAFPLITGPDRLEFRLLPPGGLDDGDPATAGLRPGPHGLREPDPSRCPLAAPGDIGLVLVPGLGFARGGARLGRGAGYYDRWLASLPPGIPSIGVAFALQIVHDLPCQPHDWRVDHIVTDAGWIPGARGLPRPPA